MPARELPAPSPDDLRRHESAIAGLRALPADAKSRVQHRLQALEHLWRDIPPTRSLRRCELPRRAVVPSAEDVACVARFAGHPSPEVRRWVFQALRHATPHRERLAPVVRAGLVDPSPVVQIHAASAAHRLGLGESIAAALVAALADPVWTVRWYAAAALATTGRREQAAAAFAAAFPERRAARASEFDVHAERWRRLAAAFDPPPPAIAARL
ncbi:HEAT repeat-containing protein [Nannocystis exedens]|uniref:HEAT repeat-containing protein n=1 Tax=Nannocystis exedens TaxID=54 RepID=A0A1I1YNH5_9BACT|nr:HEAT repeat domain-containing protein [Nannocystis exedens]PCC70256.1 hypothetical protein NAEX_03298 [Nannocystis exedens]SFE21071.1 HEAT repeat-containing protein [Nannocystis exedens]